MWGKSFVSRVFTKKTRVRILCCCFFLLRIIFLHNQEKIKIGYNLRYTTAPRKFEATHKFSELGGSERSGERFSPTHREKLRLSVLNSLMDLRDEQYNAWLYEERLWCWMPFFSDQNCQHLKLFILKVINNESSKSCWTSILFWRKSSRRALRIKYRFYAMMCVKTILV